MRPAAIVEGMVRTYKAVIQSTINHTTAISVVAPVVLDKALVKSAAICASTCIVSIIISNYAVCQAAVVNSSAVATKSGGIVI